MKKLVYNKKLDAEVCFLGSIDNVHEIYNAFDLFVLPSRFEGLCFVAIEAQTNGLQCILSDQVTKETKICRNTEFLSLNTELWTNEICKATGERNEDNSEFVKEAGYSIIDEAMKLQKFYLKKGK